MQGKFYVHGVSCCSLTQKPLNIKLQCVSISFHFFPFTWKFNSRKTYNTCAPLKCNGTEYRSFCEKKESSHWECFVGRLAVETNVDFWDNELRTVGYRSFHWDSQGKRAKLSRLLWNVQIQKCLSSKLFHACFALRCLYQLSMIHSGILAFLPRHHQWDDNYIKPAFPFFIGL